MNKGTKASRWHPRKIVGGQKECTRCGVWKPLDMFSSKGRYPGASARCAPCLANGAKLYRARDVEKARLSVRRGRYKRDYGITVTEYDALVAKHGGLCGACGKPPRPGLRLCVDHDHGRKAVRGLLCRPCNSAIGLLGDDEEGVAKALDYLRRRYGSTPVDIDKGY